MSVGCAEGLERDYFSDHCSVPAELHLAVSAIMLVAGSFLICSEIYLHSVSLNPSWTERPLDDQVSLVLRGMFYLFSALTFGAKTYSPQGDDRGILRFYFVAWTVSGLWLTLRAFLKMRKGFSLAFALSTEAEHVMRVMNGARNVHSVIYVLFAGRATWRIADSRTDSSRTEWMLTVIGLMLIPLSILYGSAVLYIRSALADLPNTSQSTIIRQRLLAFKKPAVIFFASAISWMSVMLLVGLLVPEHVVWLTAALLSVSMTVLALSNAVKVRNSFRHNTKASKLRTLQVLPSAAAALRSLQELEAAGRDDFDGKEAAGESRVFGVSLALLRKFAMEKDIPADYTMAQVCAELIKPVTLFEQSQQSDRRQSSRRRSTAAGRTKAKARAKVRLEALPESTPTPTQVQVHCPYAVLLGEATDSEGRRFVSQATRFVSYAWKYSWRVVFSALTSFEEQQALAGEEPSYFFIDQHDMTDTTKLSTQEMQDQVVNQLQRSIEVPGKVLMLLPVVLSRAWCLFEAFIAIIKEAEVQMCFAPADEKGYFDALGAGLFNAKEVCSTVDAMMATATEAADKEMITRRIKKEVGLGEYNERLRTFLTGQYQLVAINARSSHGLSGSSGLADVAVGSSGGGSGGSSGSKSSSGGGGGSGAGALGLGSGGVGQANVRAGGLMQVDGAAGSSGFDEVLKHMRRLHARLEAMEQKQEATAGELARQLRVLEEKQGPGAQS
eukprot:g366.t1